MSDTHHVVDLKHACHELDSLHQRVTRSWGRIEILPAGANAETCDACDVAVLVSKAELESMERALEILCELPGGKEACEELTRVARDCMDEVRQGNPEFAAASAALYAASDTSSSDRASS